jgi:dUTPase
MFLKFTTLVFLKNNTNKKNKIKNCSRICKKLINKKLTFKYKHNNLKNISMRKAKILAVEVI